jgi:hypothetical protein
MELTDNSEIKATESTDISERKEILAAGIGAVLGDEILRVSSCVRAQ